MTMKSTPKQYTYHTNIITLEYRRLWKVYQNGLLIIQGYYGKYTNSDYLSVSKERDKYKERDKVLAHY